MEYIIAAMIGIVIGMAMASISIKKEIKKYTDGRRNKY